MRERMVGRRRGWLRRRPGGGETELLAELTTFGLPVVPAAHPVAASCSCDRVGCPAPGMHPMSPAWQSEASADPVRIADWLERRPDANFVSPTGITHDVLDAPAAAGRIALERLRAASRAVGPVASCGDRYLFFTTTRTPADEDEWWPCDLDCRPESVDQLPGLRWHTRGSYVLVPPSHHPRGQPVAWLNGPGVPLPDPVPLLDALADACGQLDESELETAGPWP